MDVGEKIKEERKKAGLTQSELAAKVGVASVTIGQYERGQREPRFLILKKISNVLDVPLEKLLSIDDALEIASKRINNANELMGTLRKMSDSEMHKAGLLKFNSEEDRIAHFYSKLNTDGRLIAAKCFYKNLDSTKLSEVADYVEQLADTPQFQKTDTKEEK